MGKPVEQALFYQFDDPEELRAIRQVMRSLQIACRVLPEDAWAQTIGCLLGMKGFARALPSPEEPFDFPHEVMLLHRIKGKRLDAVLKALADAGIRPIRYKAVVTPHNTLWTLRRLCETMQKEHAYLMKDEAGRRS